MKRVTSIPGLQGNRHQLVLLFAGHARFRFLVQPTMCMESGLTGNVSPLQFSGPQQNPISMSTDGLP